MTEDEMVTWHHQLDRHEFEQTQLEDRETPDAAVHRSRKASELD